MATKPATAEGTNGTANNAKAGDVSHTWPVLLMRCEDVARVLQVTPAAVENLHRMRSLTAIKVGKVLRWRPRDVEAFVESAGTEDAG